MRKLLLCAPDHFGIEYEINPWMDRSKNAVLSLARTQWLNLRDSLETLGCSIELVVPREKLPDMVFTANAGLVVGRRFFRSNFRFPERRGEELHFENWFAEHDYEIIRMPQDLFFEGEGDALFVGDTLFCGYRFRSEMRAHRILGDLLQCLVVSVELVRDRHYHLDTCFCPLDEDSAIWYPDAFDDYGQRAIRHHVPNLVEAEPDEAAHFACNAVVLGTQVVLPDQCPGLCDTLRERGFQTHPLPMTEFLKAGGACKCLVLFLPQVEARSVGQLSTGLAKTGAQLP